MPTVQAESITTPATFKLFDLPPELQVMIFTFVYPEVIGLVLVFKSDWQMEEDNRRRRERKAYVPGVFPSVKVNEWLVSRLYFQLASQAWISAQAADVKVAKSSYDSAGTQLISGHSRLNLETVRGECDPIVHEHMPHPRSRRQHDIC